MVEEFGEAFDKDTLHPMDTEPMVIKLRENYVAKAITVPRKVPYARRDEERGRSESWRVMVSLSPLEIVQQNSAVLQFAR